MSRLLDFKHKFIKILLPIKNSFRSMGGRLKHMFVIESPELISNNLDDYEISKNEVSLKKIILFTLPNAIFTAILTVLVNFTLIFYVSIMGQPAIITGILYSIGLIFFSFFCIIWGAFADKIGKKRLLLISGVLLVIFFMLLWIPPIPSKEVPFGSIYLPLFIWLMIFMISFRIISAAFYAIYYSLIPNLSNDEEVRLKISMINMVMIMFGTLIGIIVPIMLMGIATNNIKSFNLNLYFPISSIGRFIYLQILVFTIIIGLLFIISLGSFIFHFKNNINNTSVKKSKSKFIPLIKKPFKDKNYRIWLITYFLMWFPFISFQYILINIATYLFNLRGIEFIILLIVGISISLSSILEWKKLEKKYGLKKTFIICLFFSLISSFLFLFFLIPLPHAFNVIIGIIFVSLFLSGLVGCMSFPVAILGKMIDNANAKNRESISGVYSGAFIMITSFASAASMLFVSIFIQIFGIANNFTYISILIIGGVLIGISIAIFYRIPLFSTEKSHPIQIFEQKKAICIEKKIISLEDLYKIEGNSSDIILTYREAKIFRFFEKFKEIAFTIQGFIEEFLKEVELSSTFFDKNYINIDNIEHLLLNMVSEGKIKGAYANGNYYFHF